MSAAKTERLLNLVICLLSTRRPLSRAHIRTAVPQYADQPSDAFERMFERDKDELRELGIPIATGSADPFFGDEVGYRVDREAYAVPQLEFEPDELAVLGLAARVWQQASLAGPATLALTKLRALGATGDPESLIGIEPRLHTSEPAFDAFWSAVRDRAPISFDYRRPGQAAPMTRRLEPWSVTSWRGRWYATGHDRERAAARVFRLSRVVGPVRRIGAAQSFDVGSAAEREEIFRRIGATSGEADRQLATVWAAPDAGHALRHRALSRREDPDGGTELTVEFSETHWFASEVVSLGPSVRVVRPPSLRTAVIERLTAAARKHQS
jgi:proteasome accessory factor B